MTQSNDMAAARRRAAEFVAEWRQGCPGDIAACNGPELFGEFETGMHHSGLTNVTPCGCRGSGWLPGVKGADGAVREIHLEDLMIASFNSRIRVAMKFAGDSTPDSLLLAALNAFNAAMDANHD